MLETFESSAFDTPDLFAILIPAFGVCRMRLLRSVLPQKDFARNDNREMRRNDAQ